jgi:hypothetical protein
MYVSLRWPLFSPAETGSTVKSAGKDAFVPLKGITLRNTYLVGGRGPVFVLLDAALPGPRAGRRRVDFGALDDLRVVVAVVAARRRHGCRLGC